MIKFLALLSSIQLCNACITTKPTYDCICGVLKTTDPSRIVGGGPAGEHEFPWQVAFIAEESGLMCGGILLSSQTVLTAAHCIGEIIDEVDPARPYVGVYDISKKEDGQRVEVLGVDKNYVMNNVDLGIVTIEPVTFSEKVYPICLPEDPLETFDDSDATIAGWGYTKEGGPKSDVLKKAIVRTMSNEQCVSPPFKYKPDEVKSNLMCAFAEDTDSCRYDSGGPLMVKKSKEGADYFEVVGVISRGDGCARPEYPGIYSRVQTQRRCWIEPRITGTTCPRP